jgi:NitT/TauT family transport system permease protein
MILKRIIFRKPSFFLSKDHIILDLVALVITVGLISFLSITANKLFITIKPHYQFNTISLKPQLLPLYALMTSLRIFLAAIISLVVAVLIGTLAAKNKKAEAIIIPAIDILQSVPVLGYISFALTAFIALFNNKVIGMEAAAIFAIFTAQVWNMIFSMYQSLKTLPKDLNDVASIYKLPLLEKYFRVDLPFALPGLVWNTIMSVSSSWFFVVACEAVSIGNTSFSLPGIGSYIATAILQKDIHSIYLAIVTMFIVILIYDQLIFRPFVCWADKFKYELNDNGEKSKSWFLSLLQKIIILKIIFFNIKRTLSKTISIIDTIFIRLLQINKNDPIKKEKSNFFNYIIYVVSYSLFAALSLYTLIKLSSFIHNLNAKEIIHVFLLGAATSLRIFVLIIIATIIWVPVGVYIGFRPKLTVFMQPIIQFMASFPANLVYPLVVVIIVNKDLNVNIWLSPLIILGTQWYILFNVIVGANNFPNELKEATQIFHIKNFNKWFKVIIPGIFPYLITGMITASGGAWNATIVSEAVGWGSTKLYAYGLGAYITQKTTEGDFKHIALGISVMCLYVLFFNNILWRPLYKKAEQLVHIE